MPIANSFLSNHRILNVQNPVFDGSGKIPTLQGSSLSEVVCKNFSTQAKVETNHQTLVQNWPAAQYLDVQPFVYTTTIELPILIDKDGVRTTELEFFTNWLRYMLSTFDTIEGTSYELVSLIVESATINVSEEDISLSLNFKSNFPLNWGPSNFGAGTANIRALHARKAKYYDTFIKFMPYDGGLLSGIVDDNYIIGWNNKYGIANFQIQYQSEIEQIYLTMHSFNQSLTIDTTTLTYPHLTDMINVKSVSYNGNIGIFGPELETLGVSTQVAGYQSFNPITQDIFTMAMNSGAMQLYVGGLDLDPTLITDYSNLTPLTFLPTGTMISEATTDFNAGQTYLHKRSFYGVITNTPQQTLQSGVDVDAYLT